MIAVLHTWGQNLSLHPHLHCIVPGGGIDDKGSWKRQWRSDKYLFAVKALSKVFRAKYVQQLRSNGIDDKSLSESLFAKQWVVYAKRPFGGPQQAIEYLGRYTHKVAISNHRIMQVDDVSVSFSYKDYRNGSTQKQMTLSNDEFARRFAMRIAASLCTHPALRHTQQQLEMWQTAGVTNSTAGNRKRPACKHLLRKCPCCKTGTLVTIEVFGQRGPPQQYLLQKRPVPVS